MKPKSSKTKTTFVVKYLESFERVDIPNNALYVQVHRNNDNRALQKPWFVTYFTPEGEA